MMPAHVTQEAFVITVGKELKNIQPTVVDRHALEFTPVFSWRISLLRWYWSNVLITTSTRIPLVNVEAATNSTEYVRMCPSVKNVFFHEVYISFQRNCSHTHTHTH